MLKLNKIRDLNIGASAAGRPDYVYSASGLVEYNQEFYIVADDEMQLAVFPCQGKKKAYWLPVFSGELPLDYKKRKKEKPDLESISLLPAYKFAPHGAILLVPSMSRPNRIEGALLVLGKEGIAEIIPLDFSNLHKELSAKITELNIEGVVLSGKKIHLFHRGSTGKSKSAIITLAAQGFLADLHDTHIPGSEKIENVQEYELGHRDGVELAFTDASPLDDGRIIFLSAAEASKNAYDDGLSAGSALGVLNQDLKLERMENFEGKLKLEGISLRSLGVGKLSIHLVADSDDEKIPSRLFETVWEI